MISVPLVDLKATYEPIRKQVLASFETILDKMGLFLGENVQAFEKEFTHYCGADFGLACSNGTDAATLALKAFDFKPGFEVIVPSHTFFATVESVVHAGGVPVMVDVDPKTYCLDPERIVMAITPDTAAIMPVHLYGQPADMDAITRIARDRGLKVIEDAAQAHGASYKGRKAGALGDAAAFSFYFTKNLGGFGEGGFVTAADSSVYERMKLLRHHGHASKFEHVLVGHNMRPDELQAAVLRAKLPSLDENNAKRREIARRYDAAFSSLDVITPYASPDVEHSYHCYVIQTDSRDELVHHLAECNIGTGVHYKTPAHLQPAVRTVPHRAMPMAVTESLCTKCVTLPCYPELLEEQIAHVIDEVTKFLD